ncbi:Smr/MutS family protein [Chitinophaga agrisoli]|uniref:Smr/MutS family protein n=1 Tax=Chitinophaga agrisoli TaxID=2607653 RepID=A0A5B2VTI0_9BACT|nr:Smr/MutS family protein [Chitinophaga agrisoli]KAA2242511.1 Smr/MutS family protein [Chitinophaga agrisoli]
MKYEIGDKIILLHSKEEGTVVDIVNQEMVMVEVGKVTFPVYLDQIDFPYFYRFTEKKQPSAAPRKIPGDELPIEKKKYETIRMDKGVFLSMLPIYQFDGIEDHISLLKFHLLNETSRHYNFHFQIWLRQQLELEIKNELLPFAHFYLADLLFENLNDNPRFEFTFSLKQPDPKLAPAFQKTWKIKPKQLFQQLNDLRVRRDAMLSYPLFEKYPDKAPAATQTFDTVDVGKLSPLYSKIQLAPETPIQPKYEVDLHIEKITDDWRGLSNIAILAIQLNEFQRYLDLAIAHKQVSMIAIHGLGKGKLRDEIHQVLRQTPEVGSFVNEYHPRYGNGATEIFFKY